MPMELFIFVRVSGNPSFQPILCAPCVNVVTLRKIKLTKLANLYLSRFGKLDV